jgi:hypothetical protein
LVEAIWVESILPPAAEGTEVRWRRRREKKKWVDKKRLKTGGEEGGYV